MTNLVTLGFGASAALVLTLGFGIRELSTVDRVCIADGATGAITVSDTRTGRATLADSATGDVLLTDEVSRC